MLIVYEVGIFLAYPPFSQEQAPEVVAKVLLSWFMAVFGVTGFYLPGLAVVAILLIWHVNRRDSWRINKTALVGMAVESVIFTVPPLIFHAALARRVPLATSDWAASLLLSLSAGIYEELVFRLILISVLIFLLAEVLNLNMEASELLAVLISSLVFAIHHYKGCGGSDPFEWTSFLFRAMAGIYLSGVYVLRGFGIAVGCHMFYDLIVVSFY